MKRLLTEQDRYDIRKWLWSYCKHLDIPRRQRKIYLEILYNRWEERWKAAEVTRQKEEAEREQQLDLQVEHK